MDQIINQTINSDKKKTKWFLYFFILFFLVFITRFGFWDIIIIEKRWDEVTYLLAGEYISQGKIPYIDFWDHKSILVYLIYSLASFFENKILAIRVLGSLSIFLTSGLIFIQLKRIFNVSIALFCSILFIVLNSDPLYQNTGLTILTYPFFILLSLMLTSKNVCSDFSFVLIGVLVSIICLLKLNFFPLVFIIYFIIFLISKKKFITYSLYYTLGGLLLPILWIIIYSQIDDGIQTLYTSFLLNNLNTAGDNNFFWSIREIIRFLFKDYAGSIFLISFIFSILFLFKSDDINSKIFSLLFLSSILSILIVFSGGYQLNNLYPYMILNLGLLLNCFNTRMITNGQIIKLKLNVTNKINQFFIGLSIFIFLIPFLLNSIIIIIKNNDFFLKRNFILYNSNIDKNKNVIEELKKTMKENDSIYAYDNFIYLLLNKKSPTNLTHPSSIFKLDNKFKYEIYGVESSTEEEFFRILSTKPKWLIIRENMFYPGKGQKLTNEIISEIYKHWTFQKSIEGEYVQLIFKLN